MPSSHITALMWLLPRHAIPNLHPQEKPNIPSNQPEGWFVFLLNNFRKPFFGELRMIRRITLFSALAVGAILGMGRADEPVKKDTRPQVEVVFCLDTTGSMGGL